MEGVAELPPTHSRIGGSPVNEEHARLQKRPLAAILAFPTRIDLMETRDEDACRALASHLAELAEGEFERRMGTQ